MPQELQLKTSDSIAGLSTYTFHTDSDEKLAQDALSEVVARIQGLRYENSKRAAVTIGNDHLSLQVKTSNRYSDQYSSEPFADLKMSIHSVIDSSHSKRAIEMAQEINNALNDIVGEVESAYIYF